MRPLFIISLPVLSFILLFNGGHCNREQCVAKNGSKCTAKVEIENKYTEEINSNGEHSVYLKKIKEAKEHYKECDEIKCRCHSAVISRDLKPFINGITKSMINKVRTKGTKYQIINNKLYRDKDCMFPARCAGIEHFLLHLLPKLSNLEIIVNTRDWPQINKAYGTIAPIFSFSKTKEYYDIMYPAWAFWEGGPAIGLYPRGIGRWDTHRMELAKKANSTAWEDKLDKVFFRGSRTSSERDPLVLLSREEPDLADAQYTRNQAWKSDEDTLHAPPATEVSFEDHCNYRYLFNFRGVAASFRFKHILLCKSLVFHVGDEWEEFFYPAMKPWYHYIPIKANASKKELKSIITFFKQHQNVAQEIAQNAFTFIWNHLRMKDVTCYWHKLLKKYAKLIKFDVELDKDLIEIRN